MELHAEIHPEIPRIPNVGFLVGGQVFHPGDAFTVPEEPVATLLLPMHAPWSKAAELIDYVRAIDADQAFAIHDALLSDAGLGAVGGLLGELGRPVLALLAELLGDGPDVVRLARDLLADLRRALVDLLADAIARLGARLAGELLCLLLRLTGDLAGLLAGLVGRA